MELLPVTAIVIAKDEESCLFRCLESMRWAKQKVVLDSGSTDRTVELARSLNAEVFIEEWKGYTLQKNSALEKARESWVVSLDADEEWTPEAQEDIRRLILENNPFVDGYAFRRKVFYLGKWITHGDWYPDYVIRLWRKEKGRFEGGKVHESLVLNGKCLYLKSEILHYTYRDLSDQWSRIQKYSGLWAETQLQRGRKFHWWDMVFRPPLRFLRGWILKSGWLDGWRGFLIATLCATEVYLKYRKLGRLCSKKH